MALSIRTNIASLNAQRNLATTQSALDSSLSKLSSGFRITKAGDDAAGLGISTKLESQIKSYSQAARNANDGISVVQAAEAALNEVANMITRLRELAMQAASDGIGDTERGFIQKEAVALQNEITRIAAVTKYNGTVLLSTVDGSGNPSPHTTTLNSLDFQVGIEGTGTDNTISFSAVDATLGTATYDIDGNPIPGAPDRLGIGAIDLTTKAHARGMLRNFDVGLSRISDHRATMGAVGNRLQSAIHNISDFSESLSAANSRIKDVDIAEETAAMSRAQILAQAGVSVLAQANQMPQMALKLLGG